MQIIIETMKKWGTLFAVVAIALSAFMVVQHAQAQYYDDGSDYGYDSGYDYGYDSGYDNSYDYGYDSSYDNSYDYGYDNSYDYCTDCNGSSYYDYGSYDTCYDCYGGSYDYCDTCNSTPAPTPSLSVSCDESDNTIEVGDTVVYSANVSGGSGNYTYSWSGSEGLSGSSHTVSKQYGSTGSKTATVTVHSGNKSASASCHVNVQQVQENLNVSCEASRNNAQTGDTITYSAIVSGGNGSYSYSWNGSNGLSGSSQSVSTSYSSTGSKSATVTVHSGSLTRSATCYTNIDQEQQNNDLNVSCEVDDTSVNTRDTVRYRAIATGGTGNYTYEWSGSSPIDGETGRTVDVEYTSSGNKHASVTVRSGGQTRTDSCRTVVVDKQDTNFDVSCSASPRQVYVNEDVTWTADVSGVSGSKHYEWSGTNGLDGTSRSVTERYSTPGTKHATVTVRVNGHEESDDCSVEVIGAAYNNPIPPTLSSVYLSQVPYTGPETVKYALYVGSLLLASLLGSFYVIKRKAKLSRKNVIDAFKQANLARKAN